MIAERRAYPKLVLPSAWEELHFAHLSITRAYRRRDGLQVLVGEEKHDDERWWLHVSMSYPLRLPDWDALMEIKELFIGPDKMAVQVLPRKEEHVNINPNCLHLYHCLDDDSPLPDFRRPDGEGRMQL